MAPDSSPPSSYSFHGSNSSHSKDNRSGGRTYHIPNYATNYTNERSNLITVSFDEGKGFSKVINVVIVLLIFATAVPLALITFRFWHVPKSSMHPQAAWPSARENDQTTGASQPLITMTRGFQSVPTAVHLPEAATSDSTPVGRAAGQFKWINVTPDEECHSYGKRGYSAQLNNLSVFSKWSKVCKRTAITIQDQKFEEPISCDSSWPFGSVVGHWVVSVDDVPCRPHWGVHQDRGCLKGLPRRRKFSARLKDLKGGENAIALCTTTPATIRGRILEHPTFCEKKGAWLWGSGIHGVWEVEDDTC
ncbi:hypothetical protein CVT24_004945 [Panaeolus cyanescens]|uniref:Uncharacterized protein n=1 Tax=Panaeolus cyanescens TaxID=181874 RepID=A0A409VD47_9AGAR|nr:hypothetical protein CVT24_004945 [Panaeolus cyanescens]